MDNRMTGTITRAFRVDCIERADRCMVGATLFEKDDAVTSESEAAQVLWRDGWRWCNGPLCPNCVEDTGMES